MQEGKQMEPVIHILDQALNRESLSVGSAHVDIVCHTKMI